MESRMPQAESLLQNTGFRELTEAQAEDFVRAPAPQHGNPYLLRGVGAVNRKFPLEVFIRQNGDVWVGGEAISRCVVPLERRAVVAWLPQAPHEAYVTFTVGR